jgi:hypothetical protein
LVLAPAGTADVARDQADGPDRCDRCGRRFDRDPEAFNEGHYRAEIATAGDAVGRRVLFVCPDGCRAITNQATHRPGRNTPMTEATTDPMAGLIQKLNPVLSDDSERQLIATFPLLDSEEEPTAMTLDWLTEMPDVIVVVVDNDAIPRTHTLEDGRTVQVFRVRA